MQGSSSVALNSVILAGPLADLEVDASTVVVHPWIVDTGIEYDHELINEGIALRDAHRTARRP